MIGWYARLCYELVVKKKFVEFDLTSVHQHECTACCSCLKRHTSANIHLKLLYQWASFVYAQNWMDQKNIQQLKTRKTITNCCKCGSTLTLYELRKTSWKNSRYCLKSSNIIQSYITWFLSFLAVYVYPLILHTRNMQALSNIMSSITKI